MSQIQESFEEVKRAFDPMMERAQLIQVATAIHAARIVSAGFMDAQLDSSVTEALDLIEACDAFLSDETDEPAEP